MRQKSPALKAPARVFGRPSQPTKAHRSGGIRPGIFYATFAALFSTNVLTMVGFLMAPDIAGLMNGQSETVFAAYEDRIAQLRIEVDRLHSRQYAQTGDLNLQLQELTQQQEVLLEQHTYVKQLAQKAAELGIQTADLPAEDDDEPPVLFTSALAAPKGDAASEVAAAAVSMKAMMTDSRLALAAISQEANSATSDILSELKSIGIQPSMPDGEDGVGGPFIPATDAGDTTSIVDDANAVFEALNRFKAARVAIDSAPIHRPLAGKTRMSSTYGNRRDPFTGRRAFHAGMDFPAPRGTTVLSAGEGTITFVGQKSGYGNMVEVTHSTTLVTRYAHLASFLVKEGQKVSTGTPIAKVGSTGRSTGPHLHFEVRRKDSAVDPATYLAAGKRLIRYLSAAG